MNAKIRVAMVLNDMNVNGISTMVMNYCREIDVKTFSVSILAGAPIADVYKAQCKSSGVRLVELPSRKREIVLYFLAYNAAVRKGRYDVIHIHGNSATITAELAIAFLHGAKVRIAHSHNSTCTYMRTHRLLLPLFNRLYTDGFACGILAGKWLFGKRAFQVLPNGFHTEEFVFKPEARDRVREELGLTGQFIVGHIGRFNDQKNHPFLLRIFQEIGAQRQDAYLLLVGSGPNYQEVKTLIERHPYKDRIILYGETAKPQELYAAMDVFVLPSKFEGLGIVLLEAQISGLPCIVSDIVPEEIELGDSVTYLPLSESPLRWAETILNCRQPDREAYYRLNNKRIMAYDISRNVKQLETSYLKMTGYPGA